jgi:hypothetical protein
MYFLRQGHSTDKIVLAYTLSGALCAGTFALLGDRNALGQCSFLQCEQVSSALATLRMQTDRIVYRQDAPLEVNRVFSGTTSDP